MSGARFGLASGRQSTVRPVFSLMWGARGEAADVIAQRLRSTVDVVRSIGGPFERPWSVMSEDDVDAPRPPLPHEEAGWVNLVVAGYEKQVDGGPYVPGGSDISLATARAEGESRVEITVHAGMTGLVGLNRVLISGDLLRRGYEPLWHALDPAIVPGVLGRLVSIWAPDDASLTTQELIRAQHRGASRNAPRVGPVSWLSDAVWSAPRELDGAEVQRFGEGSFVSVGSREDPTADPEQVMAVLEDLLIAGMRAEMPTPQSHEPTVPAAVPA